MCQTIKYYSPMCGHMWLQLASPCIWGATLLTCYMYQDGLTIVNRLPPYSEEYHVSLRHCPQCSTRGCYDMNYVRMIKKETKGIKFGKGPGKNATGVECPCVVM
jgi:hypothetical protein